MMVFVFYTERHRSKMDENTMQRGPDTASRKRKSSPLTAAVTALCSRLRKGFRTQRGDSDGGTNAREAQTLPKMAGSGAASQIEPSDVDRLASAVFERLLHARESDVIADPQAALFTIAADLARQLPIPAMCATPNGDGFLTGADPTLIKRCVEELEAPCRVTLLRHVNEGLTYRQIAEYSGTSPDLVLAQLRTAYSQLRLSLAGGAEGTSGSSVESSTRKERSHSAVGPSN